MHEKRMAFAYQRKNEVGVPAHELKRLAVLASMGLQNHRVQAKVLQRLKEHAWSLERALHQQEMFRPVEGRAAIYQKFGLGTAIAKVPTIFLRRENSRAQIVRVAFRETLKQSRRTFR